MAATVQQGALQRSRVIERPRLISLLADSSARVHVLVAPAGYGKTTLADQWISSGGRRGAWFRARRSSTDVAALALDIARAAAAVVPGCDERLREHLRAVPAPGEHPDVLAEILGEDLATWPADAWLVVDEYQEITPAPEAERFVEALIDSSPAQLLVASRQQPSWATQRRVLRGELFELTQDDLAMSEAEAAEVLADRSATSASGVVAVAEGWPAVIGLASVLLVDVDDSAGPLSESHEVRESLYRFFAEEIFGALDESIQHGLVTLAIAPVVDRELAEQLLGSDVADAVCTTALNVGIMGERGGQLELHPLARSFLDKRARRFAAAAKRTALRCVEHYRERKDWAGALDVIDRFALRDELVPTLIDGMDELLEIAQLSTIEAWCETADRLAIASPSLALAKAETALRQARLTEAQTHAEAAAAEESAHTYRALCVAGRAAHLASREEEAVELYRKAEAAADTDEERREALWSGVACLIDMESSEAERQLNALRASIVRSSPRDVIRSAAAGMVYGFKFGHMDLAEADRAHQLINSVRDPLVRSSFQCLYGGALSLCARYDDALEVSESVLTLARRLRLDFALQYALHARAAAHAGLRMWAAAERDINEALMATRAAHDSYGEHICLALKIRILVQQGRHGPALALKIPSLAGSLPSGRAEAVASRALALASASRLKEAVQTVDTIRGLSSAIEPTVLISGVDAIVSLKSGDASAQQRVVDFADLAAEHGAVDLLITAYRSSPELLGLLLRTMNRRDDVVSLLVRAGDVDLAEVLGQQVALDDPTTRLSPRERDVFSYLQTGMTNAQIAATLVIAESTVKVHVHRILEKLGFDNRNAIAFQALLAKGPQATSAMDETGAGAESSLL